MTLAEPKRPALTIAGIGTDVGKTVVASVFCEAFDLTYWKPVQAGALDHSDSHEVARLAPSVTIEEEAVRLSEPMSPHAAAEIDGLVLDPEEWAAPDVERLLIELAGGLMVPLRDDYLTIDLVEKLQFPTVLVANFYLGSINHTLLSLELLQQRDVEVVGIVFNGTPNAASRDVILRYSDVELLADIPPATPLTDEFVRTQADALRKHPRLAGLRP